MNNYIILIPVLISQTSTAIFAVNSTIPELIASENLIPFVGLIKSGEAISVQVMLPD